MGGFNVWPFSEEQIDEERQRSEVVASALRRCPTGCLRQAISFCSIRFAQE
jgi:hypothetical protein